MTFTLVERRSGAVIAEFNRESEALEFARAEMTPADQWGLFEFGREDRFIAAGADLQAVASPTGFPAATASVLVLNTALASTASANRNIGTYLRLVDAPRPGAIPQPGVSTGVASRVAT